MPTRKWDIKTWVGLEWCGLRLHILLGQVTTERRRAGGGATADTLPGLTLACQRLLLPWIAVALLLPRASLTPVKCTAPFVSRNYSPLCPETRSAYSVQ